MTLYWKGIAAVLLAVILSLAVGKQEKDMAAMVTIAVCVMGMTIALYYLEPVIQLLQRLEKIGQLQGDMIGILLKAVGIGLVSEISAMVCADAGKESMGKVLQTLGTAVILWLSVPVFTALLQLLQQILGEA